MAILAECRCVTESKAPEIRSAHVAIIWADQKRLKKDRYWINYRMPNGKQHKEAVGASKDFAAQ